jgi:hypothetical protein
MGEAARCMVATLSSAIGEIAINQMTQLKLSAIVFAVLWTGGMLWWNAPPDIVSLIIWTICGVVVGYLWYRAARWLALRPR